MIQFRPESIPSADRSADDDEGGFAVVDNVGFVLVEGRETPLRLHGLNYFKGVV
jgi:hypothetical protein